MFNITRKPRDPMLEWLYNLERRMGRMFNEPLAEFEPIGETSTTWMPVVDITEDPEFVRITAEVPGVKPEDVKILVEGNVLTIQGTKQQLAEIKAEKVYRFERAYGAFERSFTLPATVDPEHIKAAYDAGVLTVLLPKVERAKPRQIKVELTKLEKPIKV